MCLLHNIYIRDTITFGHVNSFDFRFVVTTKTIMNETHTNREADNKLCTPLKPINHFLKAK